MTSIVATKLDSKTASNGSSDPAASQISGARILLVGLLHEGVILDRNCWMALA